MCAAQLAAVGDPVTAAFPRPTDSANVPRPLNRSAMVPALAVTACAASTSAASPSAVACKKANGGKGTDTPPKLTVTGSGSQRRSEEHTSELQSLMRISYAVFCLKKKNTNTHTHE